jgi:RimJ/RimL family protein N-acetyltransferase
LLHRGIRRLSGLHPTYPLETERLSLRPLTEDDVEALHAIQSREDATRYLYWGPRNEDEVREALVKHMSDGILSGEGAALLAIVLAATDELIGTLAFFWRSEEHRSGEIGFLLHPDHQGQGYATEASELFLGLAFDEIGLHRVTGSLDARNVASARVLERLGMRQEAHLVENEWVKGEWTSELIYAILESEYRAQRKKGV